VASGGLKDGRAHPDLQGAPGEAAMKTLDPDLLVRNLDGDGDLIAHVVSLFFQASAEALEAMRGALDGDDAAALRRRAHELRGSLANVGAEAAAQAAKELEELAAGSGLDGARPAMSALEAEIDRLGPALRALVASARR
jgi:HPt (histidine-containing phosphotransfer) domain-containing protein